MWNYVDVFTLIEFCCLMLVLLFRVIWIFAFKNANLNKVYLIVPNRGFWRSDQIQFAVVFEETVLYWYSLKIQFNIFKINISN